MTSQLGRITYGLQHDYYQEFTITNANFGGDNPDGYAADGYYGANTMILFQTSGAIFATVSGTGIVAYSFNGTAEHGRLFPANGTGNVGRSQLTFQNRVIGKIWFRLVSGSSTVVSVEAWGTR